jgi:hypothetical protein
VEIGERNKKWIDQRGRNEWSALEGRDFPTGGDIRFKKKREVAGNVIGVKVTIGIVGLRMKGVTD